MVNRVPLCDPPGPRNWGFSTLGYPWVGTLSGPGMRPRLVVIWYEWVRPLDFTGPDGAAE
ncbi:hypothetical protein C8039_07855 [Halogeometricum sp. wsp3]|nr:hypothetical protein C8039_07855 [Halogeometricum sp. wsp3]